MAYMTQFASREQEMKKWEILSQDDKKFIFLRQITRKENDACRKLLSVDTIATRQHIINY